MNLSFTEKRALQRAIERDFETLDLNPSFKEKREIQKRIEVNLDKILNTANDRGKSLYHRLLAGEFCHFAPMVFRAALKEAALEMSGDVTKLHEPCIEYVRIHKAELGDILGKPQTLAETESYIRQTTAREELLMLFSNCAKIEIFPGVPVHIFLEDYNTALRIKNILESPNVPAYSRMEAALAYHGLSWLPYGFTPPGYWNDKDARISLEERGSLIRSVIADELKAIADLQACSHTNEQLTSRNNTKKCQYRIQDLKNECLCKVKKELFKESPVSEERAWQWVEQSVFIPRDLSDALAKFGYAPEDFKKDCAEFYRLIGGKLGVIEFGRDSAKTKSYHRGDIEVVLNGRITKRMLFHELAHAVEFNTRFSCSENFLFSRATSNARQSLNDLCLGARYRREEVVLPGQFISHYVGRFYENGDTTEVLSTGMECLASPSLFYDLITTDAEHCDYMLGICVAKEQFRRKCLDYTGDINSERIILSAKDRKAKIEWHFESELCRIGYKAIADKLAKGCRIENYGIAQGKNGHYVYKEMDDAVFSPQTPSTDLSIATLTLYIFAVSKEIKQLHNKTIEDIYREAENINKGIFPAWFTENTKLPLLRLMKNNFLFQTTIGKFLFKNVEWNELTAVLPVSEPLVKGERDVENIATYTAKALERLFAEKIPFFMKLNTSFDMISAEDFYFCLSLCGIEFSCTNKPVITPLFDYDCLCDEDFEEQKKLEQQYRDGLIPPEITYEFPITIKRYAERASCMVRFRDTAWFETNAFTVELAKGEAVPWYFQKNAYGEYECPKEIFWRQKEPEVFSAYSREYSPYSMWQRLGRKQPVTGHVLPHRPFKAKRIRCYMDI